MRTLLTIAWALAAFGGWVVSAGTAIAADRPAEEIFKELEGVKIPVLNRAKTSDRASLEEYIKHRTETVEKRSALILELYKADPGNKEIPTLMAERWGRMPLLGAKVAELKKELDEAIAHGKSDKLKREAMFVKAKVVLVETRGSGKPDLKAVEEFIKTAPKDPRVASLLYMAANFTEDVKSKVAIEDRILKEHADSQFAGLIQGARRKREAASKPLEDE